MVGSWALSNTNPGSLKLDSRDPETETGNEMEPISPISSKNMKGFVNPLDSETLKI